MIPQLNISIRRVRVKIAEATDALQKHCSNINELDVVAWLTGYEHLNKIAAYANEYCSGITQTIRLYRGHHNNYPSNFSFKYATNAIVRFAFEPVNDSIPLATIFPRMTSLHLEYPEYFSFNQHFDGLQHFEMGGSASKSHNFEQFFRLNPQLRSFQGQLIWKSADIHKYDFEQLTVKFLESYKFRPESAQNITIHMKNVRKFSICTLLEGVEFDSQLWTNDRLGMIQFEQLEAITVYAGRWFQDKLLEIITRNIGLKSVEVGNTLDYDQIMMLVNALPKLTEFTMGSSRRDSLDDVRQLLNGDRLNRIVISVFDEWVYLYEELIDQVANKWTFQKGDWNGADIFVIFERI